MSDINRFELETPWLWEDGEGEHYFRYTYHPVELCYHRHPIRMRTFSASQFEHMARGAPHTRRNNARSSSVPRSVRRYHQSQTPGQHTEHLIPTLYGPRAVRSPIIPTNRETFASTPSVRSTTRNAGPSHQRHPRNSGGFVTPTQDRCHRDAPPSAEVAAPRRRTISQQQFEALYARLTAPRTCRHFSHGQGYTSSSHGQGPRSRSVGPSSVREQWPQTHRRSRSNRAFYIYRCAVHIKLLKQERHRKLFLRPEELDNPSFFQKISLRFQGEMINTLDSNSTERLHAPKSIFSDCGKEWFAPKPLPEMPKDYKEHPDRDLVNYPYPARPMYPPKTGLLMMPDSWFQPFMKVTGVSGPYLFFGGLFAFLFKKEL